MKQKSKEKHRFIKRLHNLPMVNDIRNWVDEGDYGFATIMMIAFFVSYIGAIGVLGVIIYAIISGVQSAGVVAALSWAGLAVGFIGLLGGLSYFLFFKEIKDED